jgi:hypothetical protein
LVAPRDGVQVARTQHKQEDTAGHAQRKTFRAIAQLIWDACGENKKLQRGSGAALLERPDVVAIQRETEES